MKYLILFTLIFSTILSGSQVVKQIDQTLRSAGEDLLTKKGFTIIDLATQEAVIKEQSGQNECLDDGCFVDTGKMLAAKYLIVIEVSKLKKKEYFFKIKNILLQTSAVLETQTAIYKGKLDETAKLLRFGKKQFKKILLKMGTPKGKTPVMIHVILTDANLDMIKAMEACKDPTCGGHGACVFNKKTERSECNCFGGYERSSDGLTCEPICKPDYCGQNQKVNYYGTEYQVGYCFVKDQKPVCTCNIQLGYERKGTQCVKHNLKCDPKTSYLAVDKEGKSYCHCNAYKGYESKEGKCVKSKLPCPEKIGYLLPDKSGKMICKCNPALSVPDEKEGCIPFCKPDYCGQDIKVELKNGQKVQAGYCSVKEKKPVCRCMTHLGYELRGKRCVKVDFECPQEAGRYRVDKSGKMYCHCYRGYKSQNRSCTPVCAETDCYDDQGIKRGRCDDTSGNKKRCVCDDGYQDSNMSCIPACTVESCYPGKCSDQTGTLTCSCPKGYYFDGEDNCISPCERIDYCGEYGYCRSKNITQYSCKCKQGTIFNPRIERCVKIRDHRLCKKAGYKKMKSLGNGFYTCDGKALPVQMAAGDRHICILFSDGTVQCQGSNSYGQLGRMDQREMTRDEKNSLNKSGFSKVIAARLNSGEAEVLRGAIAVFTGDRSSCILTKDQKIKCWGSNYRDKIRSFNTPELKEQIKHKIIDRNKIYYPFEISGIDKGYGALLKRNFNCFIGSDRKLYCNGYIDRNLYHQKSQTKFKKIYLTEKLTAEASDVKKIIRNPRGLCLITGTKTGYCMENSKLFIAGKSPGRSYLTLNKVLSLEKIEDISRGRSYGCATDGRRISCWGDRNQNWELGVMEAKQFQNRRGYSSSFKLPERVEQVAVGANNSCALSKKGTVYCWGENRKGFLGFSIEKNRVPRIIPLIPAKNQEKLKAKWQKQKTLPRKVPGLKNIVELVPGDSYYCARDKRSKVYCWGSGSGFKKVPTEVKFE